MDSNNGGAKTGLARLRTTPRRGESYTAAEVDLLVDLVTEKATVLLSTAESQSKRAAWEDVARRLKRSAEQVRQKWSNIVAEVKLSKRSSPFRPYEIAALKAINAAEMAPSPQLQIIPTSVCSIPANSFLNQGSKERSSPSTSTGTTSNGDLPTATLSIVSLSNREVSITPVKRVDPSSDELQVLRVSQSVLTQTDQPPAKRPRQEDLLQRLVSLEERRLALEQERLTLDREKLQCMRDLVRALGPSNGQALNKALATLL